MRLLTAALLWLLPFGITFGQTMPPAEMSGYIISTLLPSEKIKGKAKVQPDGSFFYEGDNGVTMSGQIDFSDSSKVTGTGTTQLPTLLFLQLKYPDGTPSTHVNFKGSLAGGVFKGTYSSKFEQGLFFLAAPGNEGALRQESEITLPVPDDITYTKGSVPGPWLIVLPGNFTSDQEFGEEVSALTTASTVESELKRAGFGVVDSGKLSSVVPTLLKAYTSGAIDSTITDLMKIGTLAETKWVVLVDIESASKLNKPVPQASENTRSRPRKRNSNVEKFSAVVGVLAELGDKREVDLWGIRAKYRILDRSTAALLHEGTAEDILMTAQTTSKDLATFTKHPRDVSFHSMMRRVVQLAVEDISKRYK